MWWQRHLSEFVTLFLVVCPFAALPVFLVVTAAFEPKIQRKVALAAVVISFAVLIFFIFAGAFLLAQMGIPIRAFQVAGGIVIFLIALDMIRGDVPGGDAYTAGQNPLAFAVYPIGIPKIAGPGTMLTVILLTDDDRHNILGQLATIGVLALVLAITLLILLAAVPISRLLGQTGIGVVTRVTGMLLAALAVSMVLGALAAWLNLPPL
jgi:multiple antibiotic resistance protein